jgi:hypothetical protein
MFAESRANTNLLHFQAKTAGMVFVHGKMKIFKKNSRGPEKHTQPPLT